MNKQELDRLVEEGILYNHQHEDLDLTIYNYTQEVQFHKMWNSNTLQCRGLIMNSESEIVARPFKKFFNWEELNIFKPSGKISIYEKLDGSLIIRSFYQGKWITSSRGSFYSEQSILAEEIFKKYENNISNFLDYFDSEYTYCFELIGPSNIIVNQYENDDLIFLGSIHTKNANEILPQNHKLKEIFRIPEYFGTFDFKIDLIDEFRKHRDNFEGYVFVDENFYRFKLKLEEYVRLHRIITGFNTRSIWEILSTRQNIEDILVKVPEEFYNWVYSIAEELMICYINIMSESFKKYITAYEKSYDKKSFALLVKDEQYSGIIFSIYNSKIDQAREQAWKLIRPKKPETL